MSIFETPDPSSFFNFSNPGFLGLLSGLGQASQPSRIPMGFGSTLGMAASGLAQGQKQGLEQKIQQLQIQQGQIGLQQSQLGLQRQQAFNNMIGGPQQQQPSPMAPPQLSGGGQSSPAAATATAPPPVAGSAPLSQPTGGQGGVDPTSYFAPGTPPGQIQAAMAAASTSGPEAFWNAARDSWKVTGERPGNSLYRGMTMVGQVPMAPDPNKLIGPDGTVNQALIDADAARARAMRITPQEAGANAASAERGRLGALGASASASDPTIQSFVTNLRSGMLQSLAQVPVALRPAVSKALAESPQDSFPPRIAAQWSNTAAKIRAPFINNENYKLASNSLPYLAKIDAAMKIPGSVSDQDMLDSITKLNQGGTGQVTEAQVRTITEGKSLSDWAGVLKKRFQSGGVLSEDQRKQIQELAHQTYKAYQKNYQAIYGQLTGAMDQAHVPNAFRGVPDFTRLAEQVDANEIPGVTPPPSGGAASPTKIPRYNPKTGDFE